MNYLVTSSIKHYSITMHLQVALEIKKYNNVHMKDIYNYLICKNFKV